jgi:hypothetical protein
LGGGEAGGGVVGAVSEFDEAVDGGLGVVLGEELELLVEEAGAEGAVGGVLVGAEEGVGVVLGELEGGEECVELGGGGFEEVGDGA